MTHLALLRAHTNCRDEFGDWLRTNLAPRIIAQPDITRFVIDVRNAPPEGPAGLYWPPSMRLDATNSQPWPGYDAAIIADGTDARLHALWSDQELKDKTDIRHIFVVTERVMLDKGLISLGLPSTGTTYLRGMYFYDDLPLSARERSWIHHASLVEKVHVGVAKYVQWRVDGYVTDNCPPIGGVAELHFQSTKDLVDGLFDSERGRNEIAHDTKQFISGGLPRLFTDQYVFR